MIKLAFIAVAGFGLWGWIAGDSSAWTLYRNSPTDHSARIHIATFDSTYGDRYNRAACEEAAQDHEKRPHDDALMRFWCEKGEFQP